MDMMGKFRYYTSKHLLHISARGAAMAVLLYIVVSWLGLALAGEEAITQWPEFPYWLLVTASTVGFGDISPGTNAGKLFTAFFVIPCGLGLFAMTIGRIAAAMTQHWQKGLLGLKVIRMKDHILVIGWQKQRTLHLLDLLLHEAEHNRQRPIVLCVDEPITNPMPDRIGFVKIESFAQPKELARARIEQASTIIIDTPKDDTNFTLALYCAKANVDAHLIAYFTGEQLSNLLKLHCPRAECTPAVAVELMVKSAMDPGSSALHHQLLSADHGMTQFSVSYPVDLPSCTFDKVFKRLKERYDALVIGIRYGKQLQINPSLDTTVDPGAQIYYIADHRLHQIDWS